MGDATLERLVMPELFLVVGDGFAIFLDESEFKLLVMLRAETKAVVRGFTALRPANCLTNLCSRRLNLWFLAHI